MDIGLLYDQKRFAATKIGSKTILTSGLSAYLYLFLSTGLYEFYFLARCLMINHQVSILILYMEKRFKICGT